MNEIDREIFQMRVQSIYLENKFSKKHTSFKAIEFKEFNNKYYALYPKLNMELKKFINHGNNVSSLGEGKFGETYRFNDSDVKNIVVKRTKGSFKDDYALEYQNLSLVPHDKVGGQGAVARAYDTATKKYYLLSTLTEGKEISSFNQYTDAHLKSLFNKMYELDKCGLYHGDLNGKNILLTRNGNVNFIDYQWAQSISKSNFFDNIKSDKLLLPVYHFPENAQMFEMATMPYYIESMGNKQYKEKFLKMYLKNKAEYHRKRYEYIKIITKNWPYPAERQAINESLATELAKSKIYKNPTENVLKIEFKKLQFLSDYRDAYGHVDPNILDRNILASPSTYLCSISSVQDYRKEIAKQMSCCYDNDIKVYLKSQLYYGDFWYEKLKTFSSDTFDYVMRAINKKTFRNETVHKFYTDERNPRIIKSARDVLSVLDARFQTSFDKNFSTPYNMDSKIKSVFERPIVNINREISFFSKDYHKYLKLKNAYKKLVDFYSKGKVLDLLNTSELLTLKIREFESYARHNMSSSFVQGLLTTMKNASSDFTVNLFRDILSGLTYENANNILVQGYKNMRKFATKL